MKAYRILITGSRDWTNAATVWQALADVVRQLPADREAVLVSGACPRGADAIAEGWARKYGLTIERHPAEWAKYGNAAGPLRNHHMASLGADIALAFIGPCTSTRCRKSRPHPSHGASGCADLAEAAGILVRRWTA